MKIFLIPSEKKSAFSFLAMNMPFYLIYKTAYQFLKEKEYNSRI